MITTENGNYFLRTYVTSEAITSYEEKAEMIWIKALSITNGSGIQLSFRVRSDVGFKINNPGKVSSYSPDRYHEKIQYLYV